MSTVDIATYFIVITVATPGLGWWATKGEQRWLVKTRKRLLGWFPAEGWVFAPHEVTNRVRSRLLIDGKGYGTVVKGTAVGKVLDCPVCFTFWAAWLPVVLAIGLSGSGWLLLVAPFSASFAARLGS